MKIKSRLTEINWQSDCHKMASGERTGTSVDKSFMNMLANILKSEGLLSNSFSAIVPNPAPETEDSIQNPDVLYREAEELFAQGKYEEALVRYFRGQRIRPDMQAFQSGLFKAQRALVESVGKRSEKQINSMWKYVLSRKRGTDTMVQQSILRRVVKETVFRDKSAVTSTSSNEDKTLEVWKGEESHNKDDELVRGEKESEEQDTKGLEEEQLALVKRLGEELPRLQELCSRNKEESVPLALDIEQMLQRTSAYTLPGLKNYHFVICNYLALAYIKRGSYELSKKYCERMKELAVELNEDELMFRAYKSTGKMYAAFGRYCWAIKNWEATMGLTQCQHTLAWIFHEMGRCYFELGKVDTALVYGRWSYDCAKSCGDSKWLLNSLILIAHSNLYLGDEGEAMESFQEAKEYAHDEATSEYIQKCVQTISEDKGYECHRIIQFRVSGNPLVHVKDYRKKVIMKYEHSNRESRQERRSIIMPIQEATDEDEDVEEKLEKSKKYFKRESRQERRSIIMPIQEVTDEDEDVDKKLEKGMDVEDHESMEDNDDNCVGRAEDEHNEGIDDRINEYFQLLTKEDLKGVNNKSVKYIEKKLEELFKHKNELLQKRTDVSSNPKTEEYDPAEESDRMQSLDTEDLSQTNFAFKEDLDFELSSRAFNPVVNPDSIIKSQAQSLMEIVKKDEKFSPRNSASMGKIMRKDASVMVNVVRGQTETKIGDVSDQTNKKRTTSKDSLAKSASKTSLKLNLKLISPSNSRKSVKWKHSNAQKSNYESSYKYQNVKGSKSLNNQKEVEQPIKSVNLAKSVYLQELRPFTLKKIKDEKKSKTKNKKQNLLSQPDNFSKKAKSKESASWPKLHSYEWKNVTDDERNKSLDLCAREMGVTKKKQNNTYAVHTWGKKLQGALIK